MFFGSMMDAAAHEFVNLRIEQSALQTFALGGKHIAVIANCRTGLRFLRQQIVYLGSCLVDERQKNLKRKTFVGQQSGCQRIAVIRKVIGKNGCQMQATATFR